MDGSADAGAGSILECLADVVAERPDDVAYSEVHPDPDVLPEGKETRHLTFDELDRRSNRLANGLVDLGVGPGDVVSFQLPNWVEFPLIYLAARKAGAVASPLLPAFREREVTHALSLCESSVYVAPTSFRGFSYATLVERLREDPEVGVDHYVLLGEDRPDHGDVRSLESLLDAPDDSLDPDLEPDDVAQIPFTTGTTGEPKGVRQTVATGMAQLRAPMEVMEIDETDVQFGAMPLAHNGGFHYVMQAPVYTGCQTVLFDKWDPEQALRTLHEEHCSIFIGPIVFLSDVLERPEVEEYPLPSLELFKCSGSPRNEGVIERAYGTFENLTVMTGWGQTENGMVTLTRRDDPPVRSVETDGRPVPGMEVAIRTTDGEDVPAGEPGELLVSGAALFDGYHRRPELTAEVFTDDGWYRSGDRATLDGDGYVSIVGRLGDVIIRGGENISAREVEDALATHPDVVDAAVVGVPDERLGERPAAWVVGEDGSELTEEAVLDHLDEYGLQPHKHPEYTIIDESVPRNQLGKVEKETVTERIVERFRE